jgi:CRISPR-associated protein Csd1
VIEVSPDDGSFQILSFGRTGLDVLVPLRGDRSGTPSEDNLKPYFLADKAMYSLGIPDKSGEDRASLVHKGFIRALLSVYKQTRNPDLRCVYKLLRSGKLKSEIKAKGIKATDWVVFKTDPKKFFHDDDSIAMAWEHYLKNQCAIIEEAECCICGKTDRVLKVFPWQVDLMNYSCPISSFNADSFESYGQSQTANAPTCFNCAGTASQMLQYLIDTEPYHSILSRDDARGAGKTPLKNQMAIYWTKSDFIPSHIDEEITFSFEELQNAVLAHSVVEEYILPPQHEEQLRRLCKFPWNTSKFAHEIKDNAFCLAVISPNKSRLVLREWLEVSLTSFLRNVGRYADALSIISPDGQKVWAPPIPAILEALKPVKTMLSKKDEDVFIPEKQDPNILRGLLRCCYAGELPPSALLERAVLRFRVFEKEPEMWKQKLGLEARRMALVAAIKLVLTYPFLKETENRGKQFYKEEVHRMEQLDEKEEKTSYLCGRLLSILEEIQRWHAVPQSIKATLVDRFYGTASSAPQSVFGTLMAMATKAHMSKLRKERFHKYEELENLLEDVSGKILKGCGFPKTLNMREQAEFALGFYTQRAVFRKQRGVILTTS